MPFRGQDHGFYEGKRVEPVNSDALNAGGGREGFPGQTVETFDESE